MATHRKRLSLLLLASSIGLSGCGFGTIALFQSSDNSSGSSAPTTPVALLGSDQLVGSSDERRGIVVPFTVIDPNNSGVSFALQWRRESESGFPDLPGTAAELEVLLSDPQQRIEKRICSEIPQAFTGRLLPGAVSNIEVRLPELASSAAGALAHELAGLTLEVLRSDSRPSALSWGASVLSTPIAAVPEAGGLNAWVLDQPAGWRLRRIALADGAVIPGVSLAGADRPTALAISPGGSEVFVASLGGLTWTVERLGLSGAAAAAVSGSSVSTDGVRGMAALNDHSVLITLDSELRRVDFNADGSASEIPVLGGLNEPWGVVVDPLSIDAVFVAERGANRIVSVDLHARSLIPLAADIAAGQGLPLPSPRAIALDSSGKHLLAVCEASAGLASLRALLLRNPINIPGAPNTSADPWVVVVGSLLGNTRASIGSGDDGLRLSAWAGSHQLAAGGGVLEQRTIESYGAATQTVRVTQAFSPPPPTGSIWRVRTAFRSMARASPTGTNNLFVWNSDDVPGGGRVYLRLTPFDASKGTSSVSTSAKRLRSAYDVVRTAAPLRDGSSPAGLAVADMDMDGDLDIVVASLGQNELAVLQQQFNVLPGNGPIGPFFPPPELVGNVCLPDERKTKRPWGLALGDINSDGRLDLASANQWPLSPPNEGGRMTLFYGLGGAPGTPVPPFPPCASWFLGDNVLTPGPIGVALGDLDGDGDLDAVSANFHEVATQSGVGGFAVYAQTPATPPFQFVQTLATPIGGAATGPLSVALADLNCDGRLDIVGAIRDGQRVDVFFHSSLAPLTFDQPADSLATITADGSPASPDMVAVADLDRDGRLDLVTANSNPQNQPSLNVFLQVTEAACGTFAPGDPAHHIVLSDPVTVTPRWVAPVDLDGDGDLDLVTANFAGGNLTLFYQFQDAQTGRLVFERVGLLGDVTSGKTPFQVGTADVDGDAVNDILVTYSENGSAVNNNVGNFSGSSPGNYLPDGDLKFGDASLTRRPRCLAAGDIDRDGDLDLVTGNRGLVVEPSGGSLGSIAGSGLSIFLQSAARSFTPATNGAIGGTADTPAVSAIEVGDVDGDGDLDIVCANEGFTATSTCADPTSPDCIAGDTLSIFLQNASGQFPSSTSVRLGSHTTTKNPRGIQLAFVDGDQRMDIVFSGDTGSGVFLQPSTGWHAAATPQILLQHAGDSVRALDIDGDGRVDITCADSAEIALFLQPIGGFAPSVAPSVVMPGGARHVSLGDLDRDGKADLIAARETANEIRVYHQPQAGFTAGTSWITLGTPGTTVQSVLRPFCTALADYDGDGDLDIVSANGDTNESPGSASEQGNLTVFAQLSPRTIAFRGARDVLGGPNSTDRPRWVLAADFDGDGELDFASANYIGNDVTVFWGGH